jgi:hypothetical protein
MCTSAGGNDVNCNGTVTYVMNYEGQCDGNYSFQTSGSNGVWMCPASEKGNALVLAALASGKSVDVYINNQGGTITCATLPNYSKATYVVIRSN